MADAAVTAAAASSFAAPDNLSALPHKGTNGRQAGPGNSTTTTTMTTGTGVAEEAAAMLGTDTAPDNASNGTGTAAEDPPSDAGVTTRATADGNAVKDAPMSRAKRVRAVKFR